MHQARLPFVIVGVCLAVVNARAQDIDPTRRTVRRTPAVELYEKCNPAVVSLTFPVPKGGKASLNEYFVVPGVHDELGIGSGFFLHEAGYLLTNAHAVSSIAVTAHTSDGKSYPADLVGMDRSVDLAILQVHTGHPVPTLPLARGNDAMVGESVVIIGSPHGLKNSCALGNVAGLGREVTASGLRLRNMLQLSAPINPGNSGGPVLDMVGEALGIVAVNKNDGQSVGFAVPAETVRKALPKLLDVERRYGILTGLTFEGDGTTRVREVAVGSPAAVTGVESGDVVRSVQSRPVLSESDVHLALIDHTQGDVIRLKLARGDETRPAYLALGKRARPDTQALLARLGLKAIPLSQNGASRMHLRVAKGLVLTDVQSGIYNGPQKPEPGDVLARINDWRPEDLDHAGRLLAESPAGQPLRLVFLRQRDNTVTRIDVNVTISK